MSPTDVSVIIPTRNEASAIAAAVGSARAAGATEIIVVDGGSHDDTVALASQAGATTIIDSPAGRGIQLNRGVQLASGTFVLFLHADNRLSEDCLNQICAHEKPTWGAFRQKIESRGFLYRLLERGNAARIKVRQVPFGDQAMFVDRQILLEQGGVGEIPLMEDVELSRRMRRIARPLLLAGPVLVDARRWKQRGVVRQTARNFAIQAAYAIGVSPERLAKWYR